MAQVLKETDILNYDSCAGRLDFPKEYSILI